MPVILVPIYDGTSLEIDWDCVDSLPRLTKDLEKGNIAIVGHTLSKYGTNSLSFNVHWVIKLADAKLGPT